jgi:tRNA A-37 threonylcarbamoyl transferase component Bud32
MDPVTGRADAATARTQYDAFARVHRAMTGDSRYRTPKPYFVAEHEGIVVVEWITGRSMTDLLLSSRTSLAEARDLMQRSGRWLKQFSASHPLAPGRLNVEDKLNGLLSIEESPLSSRRVAREAFSALRLHAERAASFQLERSWLHGDFKTDNLLVTADSIVGIDMHVQYENQVTHDLAAFINHWELALYHPRAWRWWPWRTELTRIFLESFDRDYIGTKRFPYLWTALHVMLGNWCEFSERRQQSIRHVYVERSFRSVVRRMTRQLHEAAPQRVR